MRIGCGSCCPPESADCRVDEQKEHYPDVEYHFFHDGLLDCFSLAFTTMMAEMNAIKLSVPTIMRAVIMPPLSEMTESSRISVQNR